MEGSIHHCKIHKLGIIMENRKIQVSTLDTVFRRGLSGAVTLIWGKGWKKPAKTKLGRKQSQQREQLCQKHYVGSKFSGQGTERKINHTELWGHRR